MYLQSWPRIVMEKYCVLAARKLPLPSHFLAWLILIYVLMRSHVASLMWSLKLGKMKLLRRQHFVPSGPDLFHVIVSSIIEYEDQTTATAPDPDKPRHRSTSISDLFEFG